MLFSERTEMAELLRVMIRRWQHALLFQRQLYTAKSQYWLQTRLFRTDYIAYRSYLLRYWNYNLSDIYRIVGVFISRRWNTAIPLRFHVGFHVSLIHKYIKRAFCYMGNWHNIETIIWDGNLAKGISLSHAF